ncbi:uncharacterized protein L203_100866 [Cryptococcus depauperatus CBS 7841]|uniref:Rab proteins geranylgeranyltransferase n=1 Tax=Cryptococcus depauperatus CBS 7841 TaxID=1295531 RepID=A0A1E3I9F0_9TREE|nr:rab escort protein [Cryptococcus depauperatus CBS 7841]
MELESDVYDVAVIGTGLAEAIAASALAKAGKTVLHLDPNDYYGGNQASLTLDELVEWALHRKDAIPSSCAGVTCYAASTSNLSPSLEVDQRRYSLSLFPALLPARGSLIDTLIASDVSKYVSFKLLDSVNIWQEENGKTQKVPGSKEDVFKDKSIGLLEKRKLMKFLMFAAGEFECEQVLKDKESQPLLQFLRDSFFLPDHLASSISYVISHCTSPNDETLPALIRTRRYLKSIGRYGPSAFLVGQYGGAGEITQGFCRACAVFGGTYVLGASAKPELIEPCMDGLTIKVPCHPRPVKISHLISAPDHVPEFLASSKPDQDSVVTAQCIAITSTLPEVLQHRRLMTEGMLEETDESLGNDDTALIVFPPENNKPLVRCIIHGEGTGSCPPGQFIVYLTCLISPSCSPSETLRPYLHRLVSKPVFESYYVLSRPVTVVSSSCSNITLLTPYNDNELLTEGLDHEAREGKRAYRAVIGEEGPPFFERTVSEEEEMGIEQD